MAAPRKIDYARIEPDWRAGVKSPPQLAAEYTEATGVSVSHAAIIKHFKKLGVPRDLSAKVQAKADAMVMEAMVTPKVTEETLKPATTPTEAAIVAKAASEVAAVRMTHRVDIRTGRELVMKLMGELGVLSEQPDLGQAIGAALAESSLEAGEDPAARHGKLMDAIDRVLALPARVASVRGLSEALKNLIGMEREAWGMATGAKPGSEPDKPMVIVKDFTGRRPQA